MAPDEQIITQHTASATKSASKALGVLAAVSAGGLMALRMKQAPLFFLAGAAAAALLSRKRVIPVRKPMELMPQREPDPAPPEVEAWLARQIEREQQTPVITLDVVEVSKVPELVPAPEPQITALEAMKPESIEGLGASLSPGQPDILQKTLEAERSVLGDVTTWGSFLSEAAPMPGGPSPVSSSSVPEARHVPAPLIVEEIAKASPSREEPLNASWLLDIEPLPSLDEMIADVPSHSASAATDHSAFMALAPDIAPLFDSAELPPMPAAAVPSVQPEFVPTLFQGAELPDEITVAEVAEQVSEPQPEVAPEPVVERAVGPPAESVMASLFTPPSTASEPPTLSVEALDVPVSFAEPGDASFDDPLAYLEENPSALPGGIAPQPPLRPLAPVVEAEIVVRPRGLAITRVQAKPSAEAPVEFGVVPIDREVEALVTLEEPFEPKTPPTVDSTSSDKAVSSPPELPPAPVVLPREQKARKTWRSWWRGD